MSDWVIPLIISIIITCVWFLDVFSSDDKDSDNKDKGNTNDGNVYVDWDFPLLVGMSWIIFSMEYGSVLGQWVACVLSGILYIITRREREAIPHLNYVSL